MGSSQSINNYEREKRDNYQSAVHWEGSVGRYWSWKIDDGGGEIYYFRGVDGENSDCVYDAHLKASGYYRLAGKVCDADFNIDMGTDALLCSADCNLIGKCAKDSESFGLRCLKEHYDHSHVYAYRLLIKSVACYLAIGKLDKAQELFKTIEVTLSSSTYCKHNWKYDQEWIEKIIHACLSRNAEEFTNVCLQFRHCKGSPLARPNLMALCNESYNL